jgi:hypothetical protein
MTKRLITLKAAALPRFGQQEIVNPNMDKNLK